MLNQFEKIDEQIKKLETQTREHKRAVIDMRKKLESLNGELKKQKKIINAMDSNAVERFRENLDAMDNTATLARWYILKSAVFSGLRQLTQHRSKDDQLKMLQWFFQNDVAPIEAWMKFESADLATWLNFVDSNTKLLSFAPKLTVVEN